MTEPLKEELSDIGHFVSEYAAHMMGCGVHTSRVVRCAKRLGEAFGATIRINIFQRTLTLAAIDPNSHEHYNEVTDIPELPISFERNSRLSALSWEAYDKKLSLAEAIEEYNKITSSPFVHPFFVLILTGLANASFCRLFGGDWLSVSIVFSATITGMFFRQRMGARKVNLYINVIVSAFVASLCASMALNFETTADIALATSVLFLVPGVPLINGVIDIVEGYILTGFSRLVQASLLIICIAIGLSSTLIIFKDSLL